MVAACGTWRFGLQVIGPRDFTQSNIPQPGRLATAPHQTNDL